MAKLKIKRIRAKNPSALSVPLKFALDFTAAPAAERNPKKEIIIRKDGKPSVISHTFTIQKSFGNICLFKAGVEAYKSRNSIHIPEVNSPAKTDTSEFTKRIPFPDLGLEVEYVIYSDSGILIDKNHLLLNLDDELVESELAGVQPSEG